MAETRPNPLHFPLAFATGGLLTLMVHFNGELAHHGGALFSSWGAHATGTVVAVLLLLALRGRGPRVSMLGRGAPLWAYAGGLSGAATVMLSSLAVNSPLALAGTLALGLGGQVAFSLAADRWGLFGLPRRRLDKRDAGALALIAAGSVLIIGQLAP
ncbi:MAG: hypothetical protein DI629_08695 [Mesorhizobium amorphae]|nr:MAG: hypothetical protein DI629_08695 [Mesorhizobium amorphae]